MKLSTNSKKSMLILFSYELAINYIKNSISQELFSNGLATVIDEFL